MFFVGFLIFASPVLGNLPEDPNSQNDSPFSVPQGLEARVDFWKKIYSAYTTRQAVIHDINNLNVIYEVVDLGGLSSWQAERKLNGVKAKYRDLLRNLAGKNDRSTLTSEEARIADMVQGQYYTASRNIRSQIGQKDRFREGLARSGMYMDEIRKIFRERGLPEELTALPHVESSFQINAYSSAGAAGIWQFTRGTGRLFLKIGYEVDERRDPILSTHAAAKLLKMNYDELQSWPLAVTAYNHGLEGMKRAKRLFGDNIVKIIERYDSRSFGFASGNFYSEFLAALEVSRNHQDYFPGVELARPLETVAVRFQDYVNITTASSYFKMTPEEVARHNPALRPPVLSGRKRIPAGFVFKAPVEKLDSLATRYKVIPASLKFDRQTPSKWYTVARGDTLSHIVSRMNVDFDEMKRLNNIGRDNRIHPGQVLQLPIRESGEPASAVVAQADILPKSVARKSRSSEPDDLPREGNGVVVYKVKEKENLSVIARRFNAEPMKLARFNQVKDPDALLPGQILKIPRSLVVAQAVKQTNEPDNAAEIQKPKKFYLKVDKPDETEKQQEGDEAVSASETEDETQAGVQLTNLETPSAVPAVMEMNKKRPAFLPVLFSTKKNRDSKVGVITVDFDETLSHYAEWAGVSVADILRANNLSKDSSIRINQKIKLPFSRRIPSHFEEKRQEYHRAIQEDFYNNFRVSKLSVRNIKKGETIWEICGAEIPFWLFGNYNSDKDINSLAEGQTIVIPAITPLKSSDA
ncbi:MAG: LysM peptidoglycan-binding domain-containing protein [Nitrospinae bacterium]|nr:LysM peptidoglycan-binding domain-containing protein [Nitrospinota bacterium]